MDHGARKAHEASGMAGVHEGAHGVCKSDGVVLGDMTKRPP